MTTPATLNVPEHNITKVVSFGYKYPDLPEPSRPGCRYDVRDWLTKNPHSHVHLRQLRGTDKAVVDYIMTTPRFFTLYRSFLVGVCCNVSGVLYVGCTGGQHRSVAIAEMLGVDLQVPVEHRDIWRTG